MPPKKIKVVSDGNELEYQTTISPLPSSKNKQIFITYKYTKSDTKMGKLIGWTEQEFDILIKNGIIK
jgi:hypothetical protein